MFLLSRSILLRRCSPKRATITTTTTLDQDTGGGGGSFSVGRVGGNVVVRTVSASAAANSASAGRSNFR